MYRKLSCVLCAALTLTAVSAVQAAPEAADDISARLEKLLREQENSPMRVFSDGSSCPTGYTPDSMRDFRAA